MPNSFTGEAENLFSAVYDFLSDRYCQDERNVITATVHNDEKTPHMHFCFIPVVEGRVNAKALVNRADLQTLHQDLQRHLHGLGFDVDVLNGATAEGNKTVKQLKIDTLNKELEITKARLDNTKTALSAVETAYNAEKAYTDACREASESAKVVPSYATVHRGILGKPDTITMPLEKYKNTVMTANQIDAVQQAQQRLDNGIRRTLHFAEAQEATTKKLQVENETLKRENASLRASIVETWQKLNKVLDRLGERFRSVFRHEWERADKAEEHQKNDNDFSI
jgi:peptidoglycan hydrolase CwlO-like protein